MTSPGAGPQETAATELVRGFNDLGAALLRQSPGDINCILSPFSIGLVLSAAALGARGSTRGELARLIGLPDDGMERSSDIGALLQRVKTRTVEEWTYDRRTETSAVVKREAFALHTANALFVQDGYPLLASFQERLLTDFEAHCMALDFDAAEEAASRINQWVATHTRQKITEIVSPSNLSPESRLVLANAVYFFAEWADQFSEDRTRPEPFHLLPGAGRSTVDVPMMRQTLGLPYVDDRRAGLQAVRIPYRALGMVILLPDPGRLDEVERVASADSLERLLGGMETRHVELALPRFSLRTSVELNHSFEALGVRDAFERRRADFKGITDHPDGLYISQILHQAVIRVDEYGTEAAAATAMTFALAAVEPEAPTPIPFVVNRPFWFAIHDEETGAVLFLGRVTDPAQ